MMINKFNTIMYDTRGDECYGNGYNYHKGKPALITITGVKTRPQLTFEMRSEYWNKWGRVINVRYWEMSLDQFKEAFPEQIGRYMDNIETQEELDIIHKYLKIWIKN